ncbi:vWA domain-containing protein [Desulfosporosinus youngiae]|uniref:Mg-chelatase subunit ChlD n=1 Tax=Desulfosporosinus youngiae DSM 17734 TaxID=768710 RepID=H5Y5X5_9FIRM|nr:vWA domain-containing protein [Desulfosporosinus youngiae]EHQ90914.1 Mg-chelatase subunit ChlD [Desulfosporosinus youngiae DSM 17734]
MNSGKSMIVFLILSVFLVTICLNPVTARSSSDDHNQAVINLVIVLDRTGSLQHSDPNRLSQEAAKLIIDLMVQKGSKIGLVQYTDKVTDRLDITDLNGQGEKNKLKYYLDGLGMPKGQSTDISSGLKEGVLMLSGLKTLENPVIILLTDGKNDFDGSDRTPDISRRDLEQALETARNKEIPVYAIGLNADGSVDQDMLSYIAEKTGGKSYIVDKADDLPNVISNVYTDALGGKLLSLEPDRTAWSENFDTYSFDVTNSSVAEADLVIRSDQDVQVKLIKPDGREAFWDDNRYIASPSRNYMSYKILNPEQGQWRFLVKGTQTNEAKISLLYNYDLGISLDKLSPSSSTGEEIIVKAHFWRQGRVIEDKNLYKDLSAVAVVENESGDISKKVPLTAGETDYQGKIKFEKPGNYQVYVQAEGKALSRKSEPQTIQITGNHGLAETSFKNLFPWSPLWILSGIVAVAALVLICLKGVPEFIEATKPKLLFGKISLRVINTETGREEMRQSKLLAPYGTSVTISKLTENSTGPFDKIVISRNRQGVCLSYCEGGSGEAAVSVNGEKVAPSQTVQLPNGCSLRVVSAVHSLKVEGRFIAF